MKSKGHGHRPLSDYTGATVVECSYTQRQKFMSAMQMIIPSADLALNGFHRRAAEIGNQLDCLLECGLIDPDEMRLQNRFQTHRQKLLIFLECTGVLQTNNASEQAIRISVIPRKVTN